MATDSKTTCRKIMGIIGTVIFFASYVPFACLVDYGFHGTQSGLFGGPYIYGFEAIANCFIWLCFIPVYPVCFIYQLIFGILYIRKHKKLKIITIAVVVSIITAILIAGFSFEYKKAQRLNKVSGEITDYLADKYGEGVTENISIIIEDYDDCSYKVTAPVLPAFGDFIVVYTDDYYDTLTDTFLSYNEDYQSDFETYLTEQYDLPDNYTIDVRIDNICFGDYRYGDDYDSLFADTAYTVSGVEVNVDSIDDEEVPDLINYVYENEYSKFEDILFEDYYMIYIKVNGENAISVVNYPDRGTANISVYSNYNGCSELNGQEVELTK